MKQGGETTGNKPLVQRQGNELRQNFEKIKRLFDFAADSIDPDTSYDAYVGLIPSGNKIPKLPDQLKDIVAAYPGEYSVVYYIDRTSSYFEEDTRGREVGLSTVEKRSQSNDRVREINFEEPGVHKHDSRLYMTVMDLINEKSFTTINTAGIDEIERPHGQASVTFTLTPDGRKDVVDSYFARLDEGIFDWRGTKQPVRWNRKLSVKRESGGDAWEYDEDYIIGRFQVQKKDERAHVRSIVRGSLEEPESIRVEIGIGGGVSGKMLYQDDKLQVFVNDPIGSYKSEAEILKQDPNYAFLLERAIDPARVVSVIQSRIRMLQEDWDKPHPVFGAALDEASPKQIR